MKKYLIIFLTLTLFISLTGCNKEKEPEINEEDYITVRDENGNEFKYHKDVADKIDKAYVLLGSYSYEELNLYADKENYLWSPGQHIIRIEVDGKQVETVNISAGVETVSGMYDVISYYIDTDNEVIYYNLPDDASFKKVERK